MKKKIDLDSWYRKDHFKFFSQFEEPFFGVTVRIDCTKAYTAAKEKQQSFFLYYLYRALKAANQVEEFRYRIKDEQVFLYDVVNASPTINRPDGSFGFSYMDYDTDETRFYENAKQITAAVQQSKGLIPAISGENTIHFSAIPWLDFTAISHARCFRFADSCPKISFGKMSDEKGNKTMPVAIHLHHALADGLHVGQFVEVFQKLLDAG
jgi:chloramphenicol O-acetyltransferase type A